jgi:hypothetical protein
MQLNEGFRSAFGSAGVSPVILWAFSPRELTGGTPALPKTSPADKYRREKCRLGRTG